MSSRVYDEVLTAQQEAERHLLDHIAEVTKWLEDHPDLPAGERNKHQGRLVELRSALEEINRQMNGEVLSP